MNSFCGSDTSFKAKKFTIQKHMGSLAVLSPKSFGIFKNQTFHFPQLSEPSNGFYQSVDDITESEKQNNKDKQGTNETESKSRPLSSFKNPAYQSTSMNSGLDSETPM